MQGRKLSEKDRHAGQVGDYEAQFVSLTGPFPGNLRCFNCMNLEPVTMIGADSDLSAS